MEILRHCTSFPRDLFNASFIACWTQMPQHYQDELIQTLEVALSIQDCPEITQAILNLAEFMDHSEKVKDVKLGSPIISQKVQ